MTIEAAPVHHLELVPMGDGAWRLCDRPRIPRGDDGDGTLVAYIERLAGGEYEAVWVWRGPAVETFPSLEAVLVAGTRRLSSTVGSESKPVPIPHRAPLSFRWARRSAR
jgi:hypothetical protein